MLAHANGVLCARTHKAATKLKETLPATSKFSEKAQSSTLQERACAIFKHTTVLGQARIVIFSLPFLLGGLGMGPYSIWYLFTEKRFHWDSWDNGVFLAGYGLMSVVSQGVVLPRLIPGLLSEHSVVSLGFWTNSAIFALYGLVRERNSWVLFTVLPACLLGTLSEPVLRHVLTQLAGPADQGALQGFVASLSTLGKSVGLCASVRTAAIDRHLACHF